MMTTVARDFRDDDAARNEKSELLPGFEGENRIIMLNGRLR